MAPSGLARAAARAGAHAAGGWLGQGQQHRDGDLADEVECHPGRARCQLAGGGALTRRGFFSACAVRCVPLQQLVRLRRWAQRRRRLWARPTRVVHVPQAESGDAADEEPLPRRVQPERRDGSDRAAALGLLGAPIFAVKTERITLTAPDTEPIWRSACSAINLLGSLSESTEWPWSRLEACLPLLMRCASARRRAGCQSIDAWQHLHAASVGPARTQQVGMGILCNIGCAGGACEQAVRDAGGVALLHTAMARLGPRDDVVQHRCR